MEKKKFIYFQENEFYIGWLEEFPDYKTQGKDLAELKENLKDIYDELCNGAIPNVMKEPLNYTLWQKYLWTESSSDQISKNAMFLRKSTMRAEDK